MYKKNKEKRDGETQSSSEDLPMGIVNKKAGDLFDGIHT